MSLDYKNKKKRHGEQGVDDWLMTYADMITLLLCFFAIFLSVSVPKEEKFEKAREDVLQHFAAPEQLEGRIKPKHQVAGNPLDKTRRDSLPSIVDQFHTGEGRSVGDGVDAGEGQSEGMGEGTKEGIGEVDRQNQRPDYGGNDAPDGDRIEVIEMPSAAFFGSGSATLSDEGKGLLEKLLQDQLMAATQRGYMLTVEGHTDDNPISTLQFPSNWELSTARAAAVVRFFLEKGVDPRHVSASGYADVFPKVPNRDNSGNALPQNQAQNRRVVIKLEKIEKTY